MLAGTSSDVGKTTVVLGIMRALRNRGLKVQGYKAGPDYIDTAFHTFATGVSSRNLDTWMLDENIIKGLMGKHSSQADIAIMEGVMGMYDGADVKSLVGSSAHLAKMTDTPVILVINGAGVAASAAAMVLGFKMFDPHVNVAGVIVNKVSGKGHYDLIKEAIEHHVGIPCVGYLTKNENISLKSRHLGLIPSVEVDALDEKIDEVSKMIESTVDLDLLMKLATQAKDHPAIESTVKDKILKIGLPLDNAFNFYYQDNLDLLEEMGCELIKFSPLEDEKLPLGLDGLYIGGGFPEVFSKDLSNNKSMITSIKDSIEAGLPTYAECGGLMYLTAYIENLDGQKFDMVGIFENGSKMTKRLQRFGYVEVVQNAPTPIGNKGLEFKAHEFHRSVVLESPNDLGPIQKYDIKKQKKTDLLSWHCGYMKYNCLGAYPHIHFYSNKQVAKGFVNTCMTYKMEKNNEA
ncbi:cobyrinate a,c-diamide synthase [Acidaminobacter sp. JC074]|nr:cobyrinate a,c-diamide synthase [Acidaminobacter sp. JC074]